MAELPESAARLWRRAHTYLPWVSLAVGLSGALLMERTPERAVLVVVAAVGAWTLAAIAAVVGGLDADRLPRLHRRAVRWGLSSTVYASQSLVQLCLFFALPFYVRASAWTPGHALFLAGLAQQYSLLVSAGLTVVGLPSLERLRRPKAVREWRTLAKEAGVVIGVMAFETFGGALVPTAPLSLEAAAIGTTVADHWVSDPVERFETAPNQVVCATAIQAPRGLRTRSCTSGATTASSWIASNSMSGAVDKPASAPGRSSAT